jgi:hypothetical protein
MESPMASVSVLMLTVSLSLAAQPRSDKDKKEPGTDLDGTYACEGLGADGMAYRGMVQIVRQAGTYRVLWTLGPDEQHLGIGIVSGDVLAVSLFGGVRGVVAYRIEPGADGPRLVGRWTVVLADGNLFSETLTRLPDKASDAPAERPRPRPTIPVRGARWA